jgi:hypothetical protein
MPKGHINLKVLNCKGLKDEDFEAAQKDGTIDNLLGSLEVMQEFDHDNQLSHHLAGNLFWRIFGAPNPTSGVTVADGNMLHYIGFGTSSTEYDYSFDEWNGDIWQLVITPLGDTLQADFKNMSGAIRTHRVVVEEDATGLRAARDIHRWLWFPTHCVSNAIREFKVLSTDDTSDTWYYYDEVRTLSRVRIKDENGVPQTIAKTTNEVLLLEWTLTMKII